MPQTESSRLSYPGLSNLSQVESNRLLYSNLPHYITNDRKSLSTGNELGSIMDQHAWRTEALENAAKLLLSPGESKSDIRKLKEKSELSIKSINAGGVPLLKEKPASSGSSPISRDIIDKVINEKPGAHQQQAAISNSNGKMAWNTSNIPASGMVIGSMTIMPVGTNSPPAQAEGLLGRLAGTRPKSPLDLSSGDSKKTTVPTTKSSSMFPSFDPSRLTADVQSKISSLDPIEQASRSNISGFQMEFMRQIAQRQQLSISRSNSTKVPSQRNPSTYSQKSTSHQAWGSCAPIGIATSNSSHSKLSSTSNTKGTLSSKMPSSQLLESNKALSSTSSSSVLKDGSIKHASSGVKETSTKYGTATNMQTTLSKDGSTKNSQPSSSPARQSVIQKDMSAKSSSSTTARLTVAKDGFPSKSSPPSSASLSKEPTSVNMASHTVHSLIAKDSGVIKSSSVSGNLKEMTSKKVVVHSAPTTKDLMEATVKLTDIAASMKIPHCLSTVKTIDRSISLNNPSKLDVSSAAKSSLSVSNLEGLPSNPQSLVKPCYVQLRSIRIHSSTQDSTKRLVPVLTRCEDPSMTKSDNSKASDALSSSNHGNSQK